MTEHAPYQRGTFYSLDADMCQSAVSKAIMVTHTLILAASREFSQRIASVLMSA